MRRQHGFTLVEIMISLGLAAVMSTFMLMLVRDQLIAYEMNDQLTKAEQNARSGMDFLETTFRRACGGLSNGRVGLNVPGVTPAVVDCVRVYDGAKVTSGVFSQGSGTTDADAIEVIYGGSPATQATVPLDTTAWTVGVPSTTGFNAGDLVLVTNYADGVLVKIAAAGVGATTLTFSPPAGATALPGVAGTAPAYNPNIGDGVMKATSIAIYKETSGQFTDMLMYDPDGMTGTHLNAQPLLEGVEDFQIALGNDTNADGILTDTGPDEFLGNKTGELNSPTPLAPWNLTGMLQMRTIRTSLLVKTTNLYTGAPPLLNALEDRLASSYTGQSSGTAQTSGSPRFRLLRMSIAPRVWNLNN